MRELDHDNESRFSCDLCSDSGIHNETREYCTACELGKRRMNLDRLAEPLRHHPFSDAMWVAHHSAIKSERAIAAADKALLLDRAQRAEAAKLNAEGRAFEMAQKLEQVERDLAELRSDDTRERVRDAIAAALGEAMDCTRVWSAWVHGSMRESDFSVVANDDDRLEEIVDAALGAILAAKEQA
jgi:hypothetical protein